MQPLIVLHTRAVYASCPRHKDSYFGECFCNQNVGYYQHNQHMHTQKYVIILVKPINSALCRLLRPVK